MCESRRRVESNGGPSSWVNNIWQFMCFPLKFNEHDVFLCVLLSSFEDCWTLSAGLWSLSCLVTQPTVANDLFLEVLNSPLPMPDLALPVCLTHVLKVNRLFLVFTHWNMGSSEMDVYPQAMALRPTPQFPLDCENLVFCKVSCWRIIWLLLQIVGPCSPRAIILRRTGRSALVSR